MYTTLISPAELAGHLDDPAWVIVDCRFDLQQPERGRQGYLAGHIPGALYAHLDNDLSAPLLPGRTGRHPLPDPAILAARLSSWGVGDATQVVAYDDAGGSSAARLWWLLRWLGHDAVAVLDGGLPLWTQEGRPLSEGEERRAPQPFTPRLRNELQISVGDVVSNLAAGPAQLFDSRTHDRYLGRPHPLDPVSGHIPGAKSAFYGDNLRPDGRFLPPEELRARFTALLGGRRAEETAFYCGSGVTACHNLLAMAHAGYALPRLYAGSWSEWVLDPARPIATGEEPSSSR